MVLAMFYDFLGNFCYGNDFKIAQDGPKGLPDGFGIDQENVKRMSNTTPFLFQT